MVEVCSRMIIQKVSGGVTTSKKVDFRKCLAIAALQNTKHGAKSSGSRSVIGRYAVRPDCDRREEGGTPRVMPRKELLAL